MSPKLTAKDKIVLILNEYNIVRDEQVHNLTSGKVILSLYISVLIGLITFSFQTGQTHFVIFAPFLVLSYLAWESGRQHVLFYGNAYLSALEIRINKLAGEKILFWAHDTSYERFFVGKFKFKHKDKSVISLNSFVFIPNLLFNAGAFIYGLIEGYKWIATPAAAAINSSVWAIAYVSGHIFFFFLIFYDMTTQRKKVTNLIEKIMIEKFSENDD